MQVTGRGNEATRVFGIFFDMSIGFTATLSQTIDIPEGTTVDLNVWLMPFDAWTDAKPLEFVLQLDDQIVSTLRPTTNQMNKWGLMAESPSRVTVTGSGPHVLSFVMRRSGYMGYQVWLDDFSLKVISGPNNAPLCE